MSDLSTQLDARKLEPGYAYWIDLKLIRTGRSIGIDEIEQRTRVPRNIVLDFESNGLRSNDHYNAVYRKSFVVAYARVLGIDERVAALAAAQDLEYDGALARAYLGLAGSTDGDLIGGEPPVSEVPVVTPPTLFDAGDARKLELQVPLRLAEFRSRIASGGFTSILAAIGMFAVIVVLWAMVPDAEQSEETTRFNVALAAPSVFQNQDPVMFPEFGEVIELTVTAATGKLGPMRIRIDSGKDNPYWLEQGESRVFDGKETFHLRGDLQNMQVTVLDVTWSLENFGSERSVLITRDDLREFLRTDRR